MNKWTELLLGLILVIGTILVAFYSQGWTALGMSWNFWNAAWVVLKGGVFWAIFGLGALFILLGLSDLKG
jgi:hypothetical protein